jgi:hypothetical protein
VVLDAIRVKGKKRRNGTKMKSLFQQSRDWIITEREAILDYLHGDVPDEEVAAAAYYELARESKSFRYAAAQYKKGAEDKIFFPSEIAFVTVAIPELRRRPDDFDFSIIQSPGREIWMCPQFPKLPWTNLSSTKKREIQSHFRQGNRSSFTTSDVELLNAMKVIEKLKKLAEETKDKRKTLRAAQRAKSLSWIPNEDVLKNPEIAAVRSNQTPWIEHIICTVNYRSGKDALVNAFRIWLESNRTELLGRCYRPPIVRDSEHSLRKFPEILKDLTAARLYETRGFSEAKKWTMQNHKREDGIIQPYFGQKVRKKLNPGLKNLKKSESGAYRGGALFEERRQWENAVENSVAAVKSLSGYGLT